MIFNMNRVTLEGRIVKDPTYKVFNAAGDGVANFDLGHNHRYVSGKNEDGSAKWEEKPTFVSISAFNGVGTKVAEKYKQGDQVIVEGRLEQSTWTDEEKKNHSILRIVADTIHYVKSAKAKEETTEEAAVASPVTAKA